jgi:hypothetical protein
MSVIRWTIPSRGPAKSPLSAQFRRFLRQERDAQNERFRVLGSVIRIGRFKRFVRLHAWGMCAEFEVVDG